jgi:hypothetical protein
MRCTRITKLFFSLFDNKNTFTTQAAKMRFGEHTAEALVEELANQTHIRAATKRMRSDGDGDADDDDDANDGGKNGGDDGGDDGGGGGASPAELDAQRDIQRSLDEADSLELYSSVLLVRLVANN